MKIIDVRTEEEFNDGHIEGAELIPLNEIMNGRLPNISKETPITLYCASGGRAEIAKSILESAGFVDVVNGGGYEDLKINFF